MQDLVMRSRWGLLRHWALGYLYTPQPPGADSQVFPPQEELPKILKTGREFMQNAEFLALHRTIETIQEGFTSNKVRDGQDM